MTEKNQTREDLQAKFLWGVSSFGLALSRRYPWYLRYSWFLPTLPIIRPRNEKIKGSWDGKRTNQRWERWRLFVNLLTAWLASANVLALHLEMLRGSTLIERIVRPYFCSNLLYILNQDILRNIRNITNQPRLVTFLRCPFHTFWVQFQAMNLYQASYIQLSRSHFPRKCQVAVG